MAGEYDVFEQAAAVAARNTRRTERPPSGERIGNVVRTAITAPAETVPVPIAPVEAATPDAVGFVFEATLDNPASLLLPFESYDRVDLGDVVAYAPKRM